MQDPALISRTLPLLQSSHGWRSLDPCPPQLGVIAEGLWVPCTSSLTRAGGSSAAGIADLSMSAGHFERGIQLVAEGHTCLAAEVGPGGSWLWIRPWWAGGVLGLHCTWVGRESNRGSQQSMGIPRLSQRVMG